MSNKLRFVTKKGECFEIENKSSAPPLGGPGTLHIFEVTDLAKERGTRRISLFLGDVDATYLNDYKRPLDNVCVNFIRRAFDNGDFSFEAANPPPGFMELTLRGIDLQPQKSSSEQEIRDFICHKAYWLSYRYSRGDGWPTTLDEQIDLEYLEVDRDAILRNIRALNEKGLIVKFNIPGEGRATDALVNEYLNLNKKKASLNTSVARTNKASKTFISGFDTYTVDRQVGCGGSGTVFRVIASDGQIFAAKVLDGAKASQQKLKRFQNEIHFCQRPGSEHIVRVVDYGLTQAGSLFYVMPYYPSTLRDQIEKRVHHDKVLRLYAQVLDSVEAAHLLEVCHRDIKPENLLYDPDANRIVLADFGIAHFKADEILATTVATGPNERLANFAYAAPEQRVPGRIVDHRADIYALGLILNEMFTGHVPHGTGFQQIKEVAPRFAYLDELVDLMMRQQPEQRPQSVSAVKNELIGHENNFVRFQSLEASKQKVIPDSELNDPLISDPIRAVDKEDYKNGTLTLRLNRAVNKDWEKCFQMRATSYSANVSSAQIAFRDDKVLIMVTEHFLPQGVAFFKQYCEDANEEYAAQVKKNHFAEIEQRRAALRRDIAEREATIRILQKIQI